MHSFGVLLRKEWLDHLLSLRFALGALISAAVLPMCMALAAADVSRLQEESEENSRSHLELLRLNKSTGWFLEGMGIDIEEPHNPMQIFARGADVALGGTAQVNALYRYEPFFQPAFSGNSTAYAMPPLDLLFIVGAVISLLALAFAHDAVCGEREQGTLGLTLTFPISRSLVIAAKWLGGFSALSAPLLIGLLVSLILLTAVAGIDLQSEHWLAVALIVFLSLLFLGAVYSLGILVSACTRQASTSMVLLLLLWTSMVHVCPNLAPHVAAQLHPVRSAHEIAEAKHRVEIEERYKMGAMVAETGVAFFDVHEDHYPVIAERKARIERQFHNELDEQIELSKTLARLSPLASFYLASAEAAGSGVSGRYRFMDQLVEYQHELVTYANIAWERSSGPDTYSIEDYPRFAFNAQTLDDRMQFLWSDIILLALWNGVFTIGSFFAFIRYDVR